MKKLLCLFLVSLSLVACAKEEDEKSSKDVTLEYELSSNGCSTGKHVFTGKTHSEAQLKVCNALKDGELNKHCAASLREMKVEQECNIPKAKSFRDNLCYKTITKNIYKTEYDERSEVQEILKVCAQQRVFHLDCINTVTDYIYTTEYDQKDEFYDVMKVCETWSEDIKDCLKTVTSDIYSTEYDQLSEVSSLIGTCNY